MVSCLDTGRRIFNFVVCVKNEERSRKDLEEEEQVCAMTIKLGFIFLFFKHVESISVFPYQLLLYFGAMSEMLEGIGRTWKGQRKGESVEQQPS